MGKTMYMLFSRSLQNFPDELHIYSLDGSPIDRVPAYKYLGIWIEKDEKDVMFKKPYK